MEFGCQSTCGLPWVPEDIDIYFFVYRSVTGTLSNRKHGVLAQKDGKERGAKNGDHVGRTGFLG